MCVYMLCACVCICCVHVCDVVCIAGEAFNGPAAVARKGKITIP